MPKLTNTAIVVIVFGIMFFMATIVFIIVTGNDPASYIGSLSSILAVLGSSAFISNLVGKVQKQTNGTLSKLQEENRVLTAALHARAVADAKAQDPAAPVDDTPSVVLPPVT
jgi:hypothetical protein